MVKETFDRTKPDQNPPPPPPDSFTNVSTTVVAGAFTVFDVEFSGQPDTDYYAMVYVTMWTGQGVMRPRKSAFRLLVSEVVPVTPFKIDISTAYTAKFGVPEIGNKIFVKVILIDSISGRQYNKGTISTRIS